MKVLLFTVVLVFATTAQASGQATINVNETNLHFGDTVSFTYEEPNHVQGVLGIALRCYQDGTLVFAAGDYPIQDTYTLGPSIAWTGGAATCAATLEDIDLTKGTVRDVADVTFAVVA
jgi:hypothetical protein